MQESLESSLVEKENTLAKTSEKLELVDSLRESLSLKETQLREVSDKLLQTEQSVSALVLVQVPRQHSLMLHFCSPPAAGERLPETQQLGKTMRRVKNRSRRPHAEAESAEGEGAFLPSQAPAKSAASSRSVRRHCLSSSFLRHRSRTSP